MGKFHINKQGKMVECTATTKACPLGGFHVEANSVDEAYTELGKQMAKKYDVLASSGILETEKKSKSKFPELDKKQENSIIESISDDYAAMKFNRLPDELKTERICEFAVQSNAHNINYIPKKLLTQKMCDLAVENSPAYLYDVPEKFKTKKLCLNAFNENPNVLEYIPTKFVTQEMSEKAVEHHGANLRFVPEQFKTAEMCEVSIKGNYENLKYIPLELRSKKICETAVKAAIRADRKETTSMKNFLKSSYGYGFSPEEKQAAAKPRTQEYNKVMWLVPEEFEEKLQELQKTYLVRK